MKLSFEKINKILLLIAIVSLLFRKGNFYGSYVPKPFELLFAVFCVATIGYLLTSRKIKQLFTLVPRNILIASASLVASIVVGWVFAVYVRHIPTDINTVLEFGTFSIGLLLFLAILFYTKDDDVSARYYLYALLVPAVYVVFVAVPTFTPGSLLAVDGNFIGLTGNVNIISKTLLIPALFFTTYAVLSRKIGPLQILLTALSSLTVALLFWISSRGALVSLAAGFVFIWAIICFHDFTWRKLIYTSLIIAFIVASGFFITPYTRKQVVLNRVLNSDATQFSHSEIKNKSLASIVKESIDKKKTPIAPIETKEGIVSVPPAQETRLQLWSFYLRQVIVKNPLGIGPHTHLESGVLNTQGDLVSTGTHNTYLQLLLWGGLIALLSFLYLLLQAYKNVYKYIKQERTPHFVALLGILFALSVTILFDDSLSLYSLWIVLALSIRTWKKN